MNSMYPAENQPFNITGLTVQAIESENTEIVETSEHIGRFQRARDISFAAVEGAALGPFRQMREIGDEVKQAGRDYRTISSLVHDRSSGISDVTSEGLDDRSSFRDKLGFAALQAWYGGPLPAYQLADDALTYPLYLKAQENLGTGAGFGIAATTTLALAVATGCAQRIAEKKKAKLIGAETVADNSEIIPPLLDATVNSALWQVVRKANEPREEDEPIKIVSHRRIAAYSGAYALVNTGLYTIAEKLPANEWVGFGAMLAGVWAIGGAYKSVKEQLAASPEESPS